MKERHFHLQHGQNLLHTAQNIYFVGIGGVSMSGLAHMTLKKGKTVWGCDREINERVVSLGCAGAYILPDGSPLPPSCDLVVYSLAIPQNHSALLEAHTRNIPLCNRAEYLSLMSETYTTRVAVAGSHGKSTVTGMLSHMLMYAGLSPQVAGGAPLSREDTCYHIGQGDIFLMEACEYKNAFLSLHPTVSVITNIDHDHPDAFPTFGDVEVAFSRFMEKSQQVIASGDCAPLLKLLPKDALTYGFSKHCDLRGILVGKQMQVWEKGNLLGTISLKLPGDYNYHNALGAICCARYLGLSFEESKTALSTFTGIGRRMDYRGTVKGAKIYLDYAHHPREIENAITAMKQEAGEVYVIFQPHTYTRTRLLWKEFQSSLALASKTILVDIYPAREEPLEGITSKQLAEGGNLCYAPSFETAVADILPHLCEGSVLILMGAGDIPKALQYFGEDFHK